MRRLPASRLPALLSGESELAGGRHRWVVASDRCIDAVPEMVLKAVSAQDRESGLFS
jgi:hypothetical protein